jgi:hypothetical protein
LEKPQKLKTVFTLFFAVFGGTHALKLIFYVLYPNPAVEISAPGYSQLFIALFVALLLTIVNGMRVSWQYAKK